MEPQLSVTPAQRLLAWVDRYRWWLFGALALLYLAATSLVWRVSPDTALYVELGRNLAVGKGYVFQGRPHGLALPGLPYMIAAMFMLFGDYGLEASNALIALFGLGTLAASYRLFRLHFDRANAVVLVVLLGVGDTYFRHTLHLLTDIPFLCGVMLLLTGYEGLRLADKTTRRGTQAANWLLIATGMLLFTFTRPTMITIYGALAATVGWHLLLGPKRRAHAAIAAIAVGVIALFLLVDPREPAKLIATGDQPITYNSAVKDAATAPVRRYENYLPMVLTNDAVPEGILGIELGLGQELGTRWLDWIPNGIFAGFVWVMGISLLRHRSLWGFLVLACLGQFAAFRIGHRYLLPIMPLLVCGVWLAARWLLARRAWPARTIAVALLVFMLVPNLVRDVLRTIEQRRQPFLVHYEDGRYAALDRLAVAMEAEAIDEDAVILANDPSYLSHKTQRVVLPVGAVHFLGVRSEEQLLAYLRERPAAYVVMEEGNILLLEKKTRRFIEHQGLTVGPVLAEGAAGGKHFTLHRLLLPEAADQDRQN